MNPYLGLDALKPFFQAASRTGGGVFVLAKTSNPGSGFLQDLLVEEKPLYLHLAEALEREGRGTGRVPGAGWGWWWGPPTRRPWLGCGKGRPTPPPPPRRGGPGGRPLKGEGLLFAASRALYYPGGRPDLKAALEAAEALLKALVE